MKPTDILFEELSSSVEELWDNYPPRIELRGWWWKKYIPFYRRQLKVVQMFLDRYWEIDTYRKEMEAEKRQESRDIMRKYL